MWVLTLFGWFPAFFIPMPLLLPTHRYKKHCANRIDLAYSGAYLTRKTVFYRFLAIWQHAG
jgi:hypothetical protein